MQPRQPPNTGQRKDSLEIIVHWNSNNPLRSSHSALNYIHWYRYCKIYNLTVTLFDWRAEMGKASASDCWEEASGKALPACTMSTSSCHWPAYTRTAGSLPSRNRTMLSDRQSAERMSKIIDCHAFQTCESPRNQTSLKVREEAGSQCHTINQ